MRERTDGGQGHAAEPHDGADTDDDPWVPCSACGAPLAPERARIDVDGAHEHSFLNPAGMRFVVMLCRNCHKAIHAVFTNAELASTYNTVESLMSHPELAKLIAFIGKQHGRVRVRSTSRRR